MHNFSKKLTNVQAHVPAMYNCTVCGTWRNGDHRAKQLSYRAHLSCIRCKCKYSSDVQRLHKARLQVATELAI